MKKTLAALILGFFALLPAHAQTVVQTPQMRAELLADRTSVAPGESVWIGLSLTMKDGWHTYWRTPGDSGFPPAIDWVLPEGVTAGEMQWPTPERIGYPGDIMTFGYHGHVMLLQELKVGQPPAGDIELKAEASWPVCTNEICVPEDGAFTLPLKIAPGASQPSASASAIEAVRAALPKPLPGSAAISRAGDTLTLTAGPGLDGKVTSAAYFPYEEGVLTNFAPQALEKDNGTLRLTMKAGAEAVTETSGVLALQMEGADPASYTLTAVVTGGADAVAPELASTPLILALLLAFAGGIILNIMPCVLPVLAMKAMSFVSRGASSAADLRRDGLAYTAGVLATFGALVGVLLGLRAAGEAVGWGFQLQSPVFVAALAYVMLILGLNLSGVFNIGGNFGFGQNLAMRSGPSGAFFTGMLAVVVATPCTAPFMGTAIGFALTQSPLEAILVFEALALGLALPYLLLTFIPAAARKMPRPGAWMERVKQILAFPLYGTAAWLVWVVAQQLDAPGLAGALAGLVLISFAAWLIGLAQKSSGRGRAWSLGTAVVAFALTIGLMTTLSSRPAMTAAQPAEGAIGTVEPYSQERLSALRAEGKPVFVNFTAAWCVTCLVNERVALSRQEVADAFKQHNVTYMKGDWTNRNAEISAALRAAGRDGVPLYLYYAANSAAPEILPQVLTPSIVVEAVTP